MFYYFYGYFNESVHKLFTLKQILNYIAVGTFKGDVQIWDAARVGALAWNHELLCSGSRDRNVFLRDIRILAYEGERKLADH